MNLMKSMIQMNICGSKTRCVVISQTLISTLNCIITFTLQSKIAWTFVKRGAKLKQDPLVTSAAIIMTEQELSMNGLPAGSIKIKSCNQVGAIILSYSPGVMKALLSTMLKK